MYILMGSFQYKLNQLELFKLIYIIDLAYETEHFGLDYKQAYLGVYSLLL